MREEGERGEGEKERGEEKNKIIRSILGLNGMCVLYKADRSTA